MHPMLASSAPDVGAAMARAAAGDDLVAIDQKLDGVRIQVHRDHDEVLVVTRTLDDVTARMPEVVEAVRALRADRLVLDGEAISIDETGRPLAFQDTASRAARHEGSGLTPYFFDLLHLDGDDLLDQPAATRWARLAQTVPPAWLVPRELTDDPTRAQQFFDEGLTLLYGFNHEEAFR